jgi:uncharacterized coiled-coil DUF342 family protein
MTECVDEFKRTRRDDLRDCITELREQIHNLVNELRVAREQRKDVKKLGARHRDAAAQRVCDVLDERDYLEKDLADRLREFNKLPMSERERERLEAEVASIDADIEYFQRHVETLHKLRLNLSVELQSR